MFIVLLRDQKYQKSARRTCAVLLPNHRRRARVSRASHAWQVRAAHGRVKVGSIAPSAISYYHACEHSARESRADSCTHCLHARWIMGGGRDSSTCADGTIKISPISLCSHPDTHPNLNREVRHSPTWHSSKSESALERFEPVAVVQQLPDGRGSVFARVAARRQKEIKRGILSSFCPFRSFRTSEKNSEREES